LEEPKEGQNQEEQEEQEPKLERPGRVKHERLKEEQKQEARHKEKLRDFKRDMTKKGKHLFDRKRKDKFLGGTKGRRGG
jgi:hypothetical protein